MIDVAAELLRPYAAGVSCIAISGRSLHDHCLVSGTQRICQVADTLRAACRDLGMHLITLLPALGIEAGTGTLNDAERALVEAELNRFGLLARTDDSQEQVIHTLRGLADLAKAPATGRHWPDGSPMHFTIVIDFAEHLLPGASAANPSDTQLAATELIHTVAQSVALNTGSNYLVLHIGSECAQLDPLISSVVRPVLLPAPDEEEKTCFFAAAMQSYPEAHFASGIDLNAAANLSSRTSNRSTFAIVVESHLLKSPISPMDLFHRKQQDVEERSEGTLKLLDTRRVNGVTLRGAGVGKARSILEKFAEGLIRRDRTMPSNVCLAGPPGIGKTDLALLVAKHANVPAFELQSPKSSLVGETERKARLQQQLLAESGPCVCFADEITEIIPTQRSEHDLDAGASRAVFGALLAGLSDSSRQGKLLFVGSTNVPHRVGEALRSRFVFLPVLRPTLSDYPRILLALAQRINPEFTADLDDDRLQQAARCFYQRFISPREILQNLQIARVLRDAKLDIETVEFAGINASAAGDAQSIVHSELAAIQACPFDGFLPWADDPGGYDWPQYLEGIVDYSTGKVDRESLARKCSDLARVSNV